jgi:hypothetical protein
MKSLIICPVGNPISFNKNFDKNFHWRLKTKERNYDILLVCYKSAETFVPEEKTFDDLRYSSGQKWKLIKTVLNDLNYSKYEYIGFFDDDLVTDIDSINEALKLASEKNIKIFQMSMADESDVFYPILRQNLRLKYTITNFIEIMGPFIHTSLIPICLELWNKYDIATGWGFDKVLCDLTKEKAAVIHTHSMYHPKRETSYNKTAAFAEMDVLLYDVFPKFMKEKYDEDWVFKDEQKNIELIFSK